MIGALGREIPIMGGLAGDGADFTQTVVAANAPPAQVLSQRSASMVPDCALAMAAPEAGMCSARAGR